MNGKSDDTAELGYPVVQHLPNGEWQWTFATADRTEQQRDFSYWCGLFGFDQDERPHKVNGKVRLIRRRMPG